MKRDLAPGGAVATTNPGLVYLATGRKTLAIDNYENNWRRWKASGVRYAVALRPAQLPDSSIGYNLLYQSTRRKLWVIEIGQLRKAASRPGFRPPRLRLRRVPPSRSR
jgi:hypothetical protein